nr:UDP-glycosyltransferase 74E2-like [Ipomoea batatas]
MRNHQSVLYDSVLAIGFWAWRSGLGYRARSFSLNLAAAPFSIIYQTATVEIPSEKSAVLSIRDCRSLRDQDMPFRYLQRLIRSHSEMMRSKWAVKNHRTIDLLQEPERQQRRRPQNSFFKPDSQACMDWLSMRDSCSGNYESEKASSRKISKSKTSEKRSDREGCPQLQESEETKLPKKISKVKTSGKRLIVKWCPQLQLHLIPLASVEIASTNAKGREQLLVVLHSRLPFIAVMIEGTTASSTNIGNAFWSSAQPLRPLGERF